MKTIIKGAIAGAMLFAGASAANAAVVVNIAQNGADVVATTSGTLNLAGLVPVSTYGFSRGVLSSVAYVATGATDGGSVSGYSGFTGPASFGAASYISATSGTGASFAINGSAFTSPYVFVANNYASGTSLGGTSLFANATFASLGLNVGSYVFRSANDTVTINIGATGAVPEPATWAMMILGTGAVGVAMRRRSKSATTTVAYAA